MSAISSFFEGIKKDDSLSQWILFLFAVVLIYILGRVLRRVINRMSMKRDGAENPVSASLLQAISKSIAFLLVALSVWIGLKIIVIPEQYQEFVQLVSKIIMSVSLGYFAYYLADIPSVGFELIITKTESSINQMFVPVIRKSLRVIVVILTILQIIQMLSDKPITSVIAGLGIGGLAIALASQDTIKHFIGSFVLAGDQAFEIGERVVVDGHDGAIESMGLRSTRIRTLEGHLVSIPNGELANRTIQNIGKRPHIRRIMSISITYDTPVDKINKSLQIVKDILDGHEGMDEEFPPRVFFKDLKSDYLEIFAIYWYHPPDFWKYMEFSEKVNLEIIKRYNEEGIDFAFPTQTLHIKKD